jgi:TadE-like protein
VILFRNQSRHNRGPREGQALAEFALVFVVFFLGIAAVIQFGLILWSTNTVTQVARDTARWAVTQSTPPCNSSGNLANLAGKAGDIAQQWSLLGYRPGLWPTATEGINTVLAEGVEADWLIPTPPPGVTILYAADCPPADATTPWFIRVRVNHVVPIFFPGLQLLLPSCSSGGYCISSTAQLRMEPKAP